MLLIDTRAAGRPERDPSPGSERAPWEPNWRLWGWVASTVAAGVASNATAGVVAYAFVLAMVVFACRAVCVLFPSLDGLREYHQ